MRKNAARFSFIQSPANRTKLLNYIDEVVNEVLDGDNSDEDVVGITKARAEFESAISSINPHMKNTSDQRRLDWSLKNFYAQALRLKLKKEGYPVGGTDRWFFSKGEKEGGGEEEEEIPDVRKIMQAGGVGLG